MHWADTDFFDQTFDETLLLLEETRRHLDLPGAALDFSPEAADTLLGSTRDLSYLTSLVTGIMSLLLLHKAVADGIIPRDELAPRVRVLMDDLEMTEKALKSHSATLHPNIAALLERGDRLNQRVHRLQDMLERGAA